MIFSNYNLQSCTNMRRNYLVKPGNFFLQKWKITECYFWANLMLRQPHVRASRASPAQKSQGLRVVNFKNFSMAIFFVFWGTHLVDRYLSYLPVKQILEKAQCDGFSFPIPG